jgi:nuclear transport factor 2 (NTF2) superfamily protein
MARLVKDARIYNNAGQLVHRGDLRDAVPDFLRQKETYYILSENREPKETYSVEELMHRKIAVFRNGQFHIDAGEWNRNYGL